MTSTSTGSAVPKVLIVEDSGSDVKQALKIFEDLGIKKFKVITGQALAVEYLRTVEEKEEELPRFILLDLLLGNDSGFEILRFWKSAPRLNKVPVVVWTNVKGKTERELCTRFGVTAFIQKDDGAPALESILRQTIAHDSWS